MIKVLGYGDNVFDDYFQQKVMYPGGNALNFSVYTHELGANSAYLGNIAYDELGAYIISVCKQMTHRNRGKRQLIIEKEIIDEFGNKTTIKEYIPTVSLDAPVGEEGGMTVGEMLAHKSTTETCFFEEREDTYSDKMNRYLNKLSNLQKEVLRLISIGFMPSEILEELHINQKMYEDCYQAIHSYRNISLLF